MKKKSLMNTVNFLKKHNSDRNMKFNSEGERIGTRNDNAQGQIVTNRVDSRLVHMTVEDTGEPVVVQRDPLTRWEDTQTRQRSSTNTAIKDAKLRKAVINSVVTKLLFSDITQGDALIQLRIQVLGFNQEKYAKLVNVSRKKISDIENNRSNPSVEVLNKVFKPFGLNVGLIPISPTVLKNLLDNGTN
ncbi:predicted DNA-binding transcriptional regulator, helix-turn-helix domain protein [Psychromonas ingrahamii 37]|uniref:Predicted DNA-binding transcriptional regulator, helix-turn-helix domain protein n=1 Tax=Psychromonas ingrahamii (strain DSM 17664 / CCUG 51855 / 37) TaxID=357804 RepID=A1STB1_PSYIN|nr:helix-turn-helix transcriptional regulator [Psychromonas ingrahamii]ABM02726.1 predicted DNA-binding transcriptional regulator, helix-turn-helix domain protein [Psychromonas ingrahamii 37]